MVSHTELLYIVTSVGFIYFFSLFLGCKPALNYSSGIVGHTTSLQLQWRIVRTRTHSNSNNWFFSDLFHIGDYGEFCCNIVSSLFGAIDSIISMLALLFGIDSDLLYSKLINLTYRFCRMLDLVSWGKQIDLGLKFSHCKGGIVILEWKVPFGIK